MKQPRKRLSEFLLEKKGKLTDREFSSRLGLSHATLNRLLNGQQNVTLDTLVEISRTLRCDIRDLFPR